MGNGCLISTLSGSYILVAVTLISSNSIVFDVSFDLGTGGDAGSTEGLGCVEPAGGTVVAAPTNASALAILLFLARPLDLS